jgi:hypothetical protein
MWHTSHVSASSLGMSAYHIALGLQDFGTSGDFIPSFLKSPKLSNFRSTLPFGVHMVQLSIVKVVTCGRSKEFHVTLGDVIMPRHFETSGFMNLENSS